MQSCFQLILEFKHTYYITLCIIFNKSYCFFVTKICQYRDYTHPIALEHLNFKQLEAKRRLDGGVL